jgi:hypothetical protein
MRIFLFTLVLRDRWLANQAPQSGRMSSAKSYKDSAFYLRLPSHLDKNKITRSALGVSSILNTQTIGIMGGAYVAQIN